MEKYWKTNWKNTVEVQLTVFGDDKKMGVGKRRQHYYGVSSIDIV